MSWLLSFVTSHVADMLTVLLTGCAVSAAATEALQSPVSTVNITSPVSTPVQVGINSYNPCASVLSVKICLLSHAFLHAGIHRQCTFISFRWVAAAV